MQKLLYELLYIMGVIFMVKRISIKGMEVPEQMKELIDEIGMDEDQLVNLINYPSPRSIVEKIVEFRDTPQGGICGDLLIETFEYFGVYTEYTKEVREKEAAMAKAMKEAADKKAIENGWHRIAAQTHIAENKESAKILKGGC